MFPITCLDVFRWKYDSQTLGMYNLTCNLYKAVLTRVTNERKMIKRSIMINLKVNRIRDKLNHFDRHYRHLDKVNNI